MFVNLMKTYGGLNKLNEMKKVSFDSVAETLYKNGYKETQLPYTYLDGSLEVVSFTKNGFGVNVWVYPKPDFVAFLETLDEGDEYAVKYENYYVSQIHLESPICNVAGFCDGDTSGITLVEEPGGYVKHSLSLFEYCLSLQTTNLLSHELMIMEKRVEHLKWAKEHLIPLLEKWDYHAEFDTFFNVDKPLDSSNQYIEFVHYNDGVVYIDTDALTGELSIKADGVDITKKIYSCCLNENGIKQVFIDDVWVNSGLRYSYLYNDDPKDTKETYKYVMDLMENIREIDSGYIHANKNLEIREDIVPDRDRYVLDAYIERTKGVN